MEPFSIACTTCRARLKVRDPAAIGQILACPKCGSMVLIEAPAGMPLPNPATAPPIARGTPRIHVSDSDSMADTVSGSFDDLDSLFSEPGGAPAAPKLRPARPNDVAVPVASTQPATGNSAVRKSLPVARSLSPPAESTAVAAFESPAPAKNGSPESLAAPSRPGTGAEGTAPAIRQFRQILLLVGAACLGIVLALVVFGVIVSWWGKRTNVATGPSTDSTPRNDAPTTDTAPAAPPATNLTPDSAPDSDSSNALPDAPAKTGDDASPSEPPAKDSPPAADNPPTPPAPNDVPPDLKPKAAAEPAADFSGLDKFTELLTGRPRAKPTDAEAAPAGADKPNGDEPSREPSLPRPPQRNVNVAARLEDKLAQIEYDAPLADFIHEMSSLTNVPISFDMPALVAKHVDLNQTVKVRETNTTVQKALAAALAPLKLGLVATDNHLLVTWPQSETTNSREVKHAVADLVGDDPERLETLGAWIVELIAPESWEAAGGTGSLKMADKSIVVTHSDAVQQQVQLFCDKLRQARELPTKKFDAEWLKSVSLAHRAIDKLTKPVALNFTRPTQFTRILDRLGKATGTRIVVDWKAAAEVGWNPDATVAFVVENQPLPEALATLLSPMDLTFRVIDESTLQITTTTALAGSLDIEFHPAADVAKDNPQSLIERITAVLGETVFRDGGGSGVIHWDAPSQSLLAVLPPPQQQALAKFLAVARVEK